MSVSTSSPSVHLHLRFSKSKNPIALPSKSPSIRRNRFENQPIASFATALQKAPLPLKKSRIDGGEKGRIREPITGDKIDRWMSESIGQIVNRIGEAPLLLQLFSDEEGSMRMETETARADEWEGIRSKWETDNRAPDAIVLVDELKLESDQECGAVDRSSPRRTWGLAVQGRGADCASCYILNTCRVKSSMGLCTHFCLARAKCFGEPWELQLRNAWLQGR